MTAMLWRLGALLLVVQLAGVATAQTIRVSPPVADVDADPICARLGTDEVCQSQPPPDSTGTYPQARMTRGGDTWEASYGPVNHDMRLLDVDGTRLVATWWAITNGIGVPLWELRILPATGGPPVVTFEVQEFDPDGGSFATHAGRTVLWTTEWWNGPDPTGRRRPGTYLVGRPFTLDAHGIVPATDLPIRARRLRTYFQNEPGGPVRWLADRRAVTWRTDPLLRGTAATTRGTVTEAAFTLDDSGPPVFTVTLHTDAGTAQTLVSSVEWTDMSSFSHLGDGPSGRLFPENYRPADVSAWLVGRRVRFETRGDGPGVLWRE